MRLLLIAALLPATACHASWEKEGHAIQPSGKGATRSFAASGFTGVELRGPDDVDVKTGPNFQVTAEGDSAILDQLEIEVVDGTLRVGRKDHQGSWFSNDPGLKVHVVMPKLASAGVAGSGDLSVDKAEGDVRAAISGSGNLSIASLNSGETDLSIAGSGDLSAAGAARNLKVSIAGSGDVAAEGLTAGGADISVVGSGNVRARVQGEAKVSIAGSGDVDLAGGAKCQVSAMGSGEAHCS